MLVSIEPRTRGGTLARTVLVGDMPGKRRHLEVPRLSDGRVVPGRRVLADRMAYRAATVVQTTVLTRRQETKQFSWGELQCAWATSS